MPEPKIIQATKEYELLFGKHPPIFGYPDDDLLIELKKALKTQSPMRGYHEIINDELGITDDDIKSGKLVKV